MKILLQILCLVVSTAAFAQQTPPLIEIYRSIPAAQDDFMLVSTPTHEELLSTSNLFWMSRQEFGKYVRPLSGLAAQVEKLKTSLVGTDYKIPAQKTVNLDGWQVTIKGEEIDPTDPRYKGAFELLKNLSKNGNWSRSDVIDGELKGAKFFVTHTKFPDQKSTGSRPQVAKHSLDGLEACDNVVGPHLVCHIPKHGFIYLQNSKETKN
jgi:hypothetical protein